jgi:hypothetical protein
MKSVEHVTTDPRLYHGALTPGITSGSELKSERSRRYREKWVRSARRTFIMPVGMYSCVVVY